MPPVARDSCKTKTLSKHNSGGNIVYKISDLKKDVDSLKATYDCGSDPNKPRIERVLTNMKRKILKAEQIMKFGQHITGRTITAERTRILQGRVAAMKNLFKELMKDQLRMTKSDRRALCQMYHQLLSMEDDLTHFTEPVQEQSSSTTCRNAGEPHFISIKDCEAQTTKYEARSGTKMLSPCKSAPRNKPLVYTGIAIGFSSPKIELNDCLTYSSVGETWKTMFSFNTEQCSLQSSPDVRSFECESSSISVNDSLVSESYSTADEVFESRKNESTSDYSLHVECSTGSTEILDDSCQLGNGQPMSFNDYYEEAQDKAVENIQRG
uniref:ATP-dependent Clp protease ATP-binding subunit ClpX n=1 Tax=Lygus hesperus TaxID=30085 RepID=A0A0A9W3I6_LYGHE